MDWNGTSGLEMDRNGGGKDRDRDRGVMEGGTRRDRERGVLKITSFSAVSKPVFGSSEAGFRLFQSRFSALSRLCGAVESALGCS